MKVRIRYRVDYETFVDLPDDTTQQEVLTLCANIDIPEGGADDSRYIPDTMEIIKIIDIEKGNCLPCN